jgi:hypothetical protein
MEKPDPAVVSEEADAIGMPRDRELQSTRSVDDALLAMRVKADALRDAEMGRGHGLSGLEATLSRISAESTREAVERKEASNEEGHRGRK